MEYKPNRMMQLALLSQFKESFVKVQNRIDGKGEDDFDQIIFNMV
jgi:hypothetical protein